VDFQTVVNLLGGAGLAAIGWFARQVWDATKELRTDLEAHRVEVAKDYTPKSDFRDAVDGLSREMREQFGRLFDKLDAKADK